jgi:hypothetical protein
MSYVKMILVGLALLFMTSGTGLADNLTSESDSPVLFESSSACSEEPALLVAQADPQSPGNVQERAVPRPGPGMAPEAAPLTKLKGGAVQGNRLQADPGYVLEPLPGNKVALKPAGGGPTIEANCICRGKGGCSFEVVGPSAYCRKSPTNGCSVNCILTVGGKLSGGRMSIQ